MFKLFIKFLKRFTVFIPGIIIAAISWQYTLPFFDKRVPYVVAILITYGIGAYLLVPAILRIYIIFFPPKHLPLYCITPDGFASDPLNIGIISTRRELILAMEKAGWYKSEPHNISTTGKMIGSVIFRQKYLNAPVSSLYLFGRKQDIAFSMPTLKTNLNRHHVRFWATTFDDVEALSPHSIHWHNRKAHVHGDELLWVGAASLDVGIMPMRHNLQVTHMVDPDTNKEREFILKGVKENAKTEKTLCIKLGDPYTLINRTWRGELRTDGVMKVIRIKKMNIKYYKTKKS